MHVEGCIPQWEAVTDARGGMRPSHGKRVTKHVEGRIPPVGGAHSSRVRGPRRTMEPWIPHA
jgi:hypothetical protein